MNRRTLLKSGLAAGGFLLLQAFSFSGGFSPRRAEAKGHFEVVKTEAEWRAVLTPEQFRVLREEWTEPPFKNKYYDHKEKGTYHCAGCDQILFSSRHKYDSNTGWPSFWQPMFSDAVGTKTDWKLLYPRTEVHCSRCGGHLGHIFKDGPPPTGLRYCINSAALKFVPSKGGNNNKG